MANSATQIRTFQLRDRDTPGLFWTVRQIKVAIDTTGADLTIRTPDTGYGVALVGIFGVDSTASNIIFKSGSTTLVSPEFTANQGLQQGVGRIMLATNTDEALVMQFSGAVDDLLVFTVDFATQAPSL